MIAAEQRQAVRRGERRAVDLIRRLTTVLEDRMTVAGHPYALVPAEHLGTCSVRECSLRCSTYRALFVEAVEYLEEHAAPVAVQPDMFAHLHPTQPPRAAVRP